MGAAALGCRLAAQRGRCSGDGVAQAADVHLSPSINELRQRPLKACHGPPCPPRRPSTATAALNPNARTLECPAMEPVIVPLGGLKARSCVRSCLAARLASGFHNSGVPFSNRLVDEPSRGVSPGACLNKLRSRCRRRRLAAGDLPPRWGRWQRTC